MKLSLCIESVFPELDFYDRIKYAANIGYDAIEMWDPSDRDINLIGQIASMNNIPIICCCLKNQWEIRVNSDIDMVLKNLYDTIDFVSDMDCRTFILMCGDIESARTDTQKNILIENLKKMAEIAEKKDVNLLLEPLNSLIDHKGYYLDSACLGFEIIKCVNSDKVKLLYDCYHMQIMEGNLIKNITANLKYVGHIHCAGVPGRNEPFLGEINYQNIVKRLQQEGYNNYFGMEYWPTYNHEQSLKDNLAYFKL